MKTHVRKRRSSLTFVLSVIVLLGPASRALLWSQDDSGAADLARIKQEEAREKLKGLEETMNRLSRLLSTTEPQNAAKLRSAFQESRDRLLREGMDRIIQFLKEKKLDRAIENQTAISQHLNELLEVLLEKDIDPRELIRHIKNLKGVLQDLDTVVQEQTREKIASDQASESKDSVGSLSEALVQLDDLIRKERGIETRMPSSGAGGGKEGRGKEGSGGEGKGGEGEKGGKEKEKTELERKLKDLIAEQQKIRASTEKLRGSKGSASGSSGSAGGSPGLDSKSLAGAEGAMKKAAEAMQAGNLGEAASQAKKARQQLEEARRKAEAELEKMRSQRDFAGMKEDQDDTLERTRDILERMKKTPPLVFSPEGGVPGKGDVSSASGSMENASGNLSGGKSKSASRDQKDALTKLNQGKQKVEETLEALQRALRDRILAYLQERFTFMLERQTAINRETISLDSRLRALAAASSSENPVDNSVDNNVDNNVDKNNAPTFEPERKDLQRAERLSRRERALAIVAEDIMDLLEEDGTTLVFPRIVAELKGDIGNVQGLLAEVKTGKLTQRIQKEIIETIEEILEAIKQAQNSPPPPNPNQGRQSKNGAGPLLPGSAELKMIRSMQQRVNKRTSDFDLDRAHNELDLGERRQASILAEKQQEIEELLRKVARALGQ